MKGDIVSIVYAECFHVFILNVEIGNTKNSTAVICHFEVGFDRSQNNKLFNSTLLLSF